jgi:hypothetical protein
MESLKKRWQATPASVRKPIVLVLGTLIVIASPFTGVLPGPGGIPVFLIGIAILATEFEWAQRIRDPIMRWIHIAGDLWRKHKIAGTLLIIALAACFFGLSFVIYKQF